MPIIRKPYELSIWKDIYDKETDKYKENKIMVIGSDSIESGNRVFSPVFTRNKNGENKLEFQIIYKFYDEVVGQTVFNPFIPYLVNERKVKLKYDDKWYDFIIKNRTESSENTYTYSCVDANVNELSKIGFNKTFSLELQNNMGTAAELGEKTLEGTNWRVGDCDIIQSNIDEPLYKGILNESIRVQKIDENGINSEEVISPSQIEEDNIIYIFYSYLHDKTTKGIQFIWNKDRVDFVVNDDNTITAPNYIVNSLGDGSEVKYENGYLNFLAVEPELYQNQGYRIVYKQKTEYDSVNSIIVDLYEAKINETETKKIYHTTTSEYVTSDSVYNFLTNSDGLGQFSSGSIDGWDCNVQSDGDKNTLSVSVYPPINYVDTDVSTTTNSKGYLKIKFNKGSIDGYKNSILNTGIKDNNSLIEQFYKGEEFVLKIKAGYVEDGNFYKIENPNLNAIVAEYEIIDDVIAVKQGSEILKFNTSPQYKQDRIVSNGTFDYLDGERISYKVNNIEIAPLIDTYYQEAKEESNEDFGEETLYVWNSSTQRYEEIVSDDKNLSSYYRTAKCLRSISNDQLINGENRFGFFLYIEENDSNLEKREYYIEKIQLYRKRLDKNGEVISLEEPPESLAISIDNYYYPLEVGSKPETTEYFRSLEDIANDLGVNESDIYPVYDNECNKYSMIEANDSNCFDILQSICEKFECWLDIDVIHTETGEIAEDNEGNPKKYIRFRKYIGKDNFAGFRYGINLESIERTFNSEEIVTKLIVPQVENEGAKNGMCTIQRAPSNYSKLSYILNFNYYISQGLLDREIVAKDLQEFYKTIGDYNKEISIIQDEIDGINSKLTKIDATRTAYTKYLDDARKNLEEAKEDLFKIAEAREGESLEPNVITISLETDTADESATFLKINLSKEKPGLTIKFLKNNDSIKTDSRIEYIIDGTRFNNIKEKDGNNWVIQYKIEGYETSYYEAQYTSSESYLYELQYNSSITLVNKNIKDALTENLTKISLNTYILENYEVIVDNLNKEHNSLVYKKSGLPELSFIIKPKSGINGSLNGVYWELNDYIENFKFNLVKEEDIQKTFETNLTYRKDSWEYFPTEVRFLSVPDEYVKPLDINNLEEGQTKAITIYPQDNFKSDNCLEAQIKGLTEERDKYESTFLKKYSSFTQEGTWKDDDYIDDELFYLDAKRSSEQNSKPEVEYSIKVIDVEPLEDFKNYNFDVGDKTYIEDTEFFGWIFDTATHARTPVKEEVIISEIECNLDDPTENNITVQNYKTNFEDLFQRLNATVQSVEYKQAGYNRAASKIDTSGIINSDTLINSFNNLSLLGYSMPLGATISADNYGIITTSLREADSRLRFSDGQLTYNDDAGSLDKIAIDGTGIYPEAIKPGQLNIGEINLIDGENTSFRWDKNGISAYYLNTTSDLVRNVWINNTHAPNKKSFLKFEVRNGIIAFPDTNENGIYMLQEDSCEYEIGSVFVWIDNIYTYINTEKVVITGDTPYDSNWLNVTSPEVGKIYEVTTSGDHLGELLTYGVPTLVYAYPNPNENITSLIDSSGNVCEDRGVWYYLDSEFEDYQRGTLFSYNGSGYSVVNDSNKERYFKKPFIEVDGNSIVGVEPYGEKWFENVTPIFGEYYKFTGSTTPAHYNVGTSLSWSSGRYRRFDLNDTSKIGYDLNRYVRFDRYGLYGTKVNFTPKTISEIKNVADFGLTWDGFFIKSSYTNGYVEISSSDDFRVMKNGDSGETEIIKIGALEQDEVTGEVTRYGIRINDADGHSVFTTGSDGRLYIENLIQVGKEDSSSNAIYINGENSSIYTSNYTEGAGAGWLINKDGDAYFNNITARGAIKTAVFEYAEIQAVGGVFLFRPSSTIRSAALDVEYIKTADIELIDGKIYYIYNNETKEYEVVENPIVTDIDLYFEQSKNDVFVTVEKPLLFSEDNWCKISNYLDNKDEASITNNNGFTHVYKIKTISDDVITLEGAGEIVNGSTAAINNIEDLVGGALVDMGNQANGSGVAGDNNYGIGINSSDNTVNLPARSISLFETIIDESKEVKVTYKYKDIFGTLPTLPYGGDGAQVSQIYNDYLKGTQGIYTDNMYIGDQNQYITFYHYLENDEEKTTLDISTANFNLKSGQESHYELTKDKEIDSKKTYYIYDSSGNKYEKVDSPVEEDLGFYYEYIESTLLYLSNKNYGKNLSVADSPRLSNWRQIVGDNFGVTADGNLYTRNTNISGSVTVGESTTIGNTLKFENGGISLGQLDSFHIYINGNSDGVKIIDNNQVYTKTYGLGFFNGDHTPEYISAEDPLAGNFDPEQNIYYSDNEGGSVVEHPIEDDKEGYFVEKEKRIAYINGSQLVIPYTVVLKGMKLSNNWIWELNEDTSNLTLKWIN